MHLKLLRKKQFKKITETTSDLIDNKIAHAVAKSYVVTRYYDNNNDKITSNADNASQTEELRK